MLRLAGQLSAEPERVVSRQSCLDLDLLTRIAFGYECGDAVPPLFGATYPNVEGIVIEDGCHRASAQNLLGGNISFSRIDECLMYINEPERWRPITSATVYARITWEGQQMIMEDGIYRSLDEVPNTFRKKIRKLLAHNAMKTSELEYQL